MEYDDFTRRFNELVTNRMRFSFDTMIPYTTITNVQKGTEPRLSVLLSILKAYPNLSAEWLLRGTTPKYISTADEIQKKEESEDMRLLKEELEQLKGKYALLKEMYDDKCAELAAQVPHVAYVLKKKESDKENK